MVFIGPQLRVGSRSFQVIIMGALSHSGPSIATNVEPQPCVTGESATHTLSASATGSGNTMSD